MTSWKRSDVANDIGRVVMLAFYADGSAYWEERSWFGELPEDCGPNRHCSVLYTGVTFMALLAPSGSD